MIFTGETMHGGEGDYTRGWVIPTGGLCMKGRGDYTRGWGMSAGGTIHGWEGRLYTGVGLWDIYRGTIHGGEEKRDYTRGWGVGVGDITGGLYMKGREDYTRWWGVGIPQGELCMEGRGDYLRGGGGGGGGDYPWLLQHFNKQIDFQRRNDPVNTFVLTASFLLPFKSVRFSFNFL